MFVCALQIKVLDGHPACCGVFSDKRQIGAVAAPLRAVEPGYLSDADDSNANKMRRALLDVIEFQVKFVQDEVKFLSYS